MWRRVGSGACGWELLLHRDFCRWFVCVAILAFAIGTGRPTVDPVVRRMPAKPPQSSGPLIVDGLGIRARGLQSA